ncbi:hypothetical protein ACFL6Y_02875 [Elusimicrobiota bacterium]
MFKLCEPLVLLMFLLSCGCAGRSRFTACDKFMDKDTEILAPRPFAGTDILSMEAEYNKRSEARVLGLYAVSKKSAAKTDIRSSEKIFRNVAILRLVHSQTGHVMWGASANTKRMDLRSTRSAADKPEKLSRSKK